MANAYKQNARLGLFPKAIYNCTSEVTKYALCVSHKDDVKKGDCEAEFIKLKSCFQKAVKNLMVKK